MTYNYYWNHRGYKNYLCLHVCVHVALGTGWKFPQEPIMSTKKAAQLSCVGAIFSHFPSRSKKYDSRSEKTNQSGGKIYKSGVRIRSQYQHSARLASNKPIINVKMVRAADKYYNFPANQRLCAREWSVCVCERLLSESIFIIGTFLSLFINKIRI